MSSLFGAILSLRGWRWDRCSVDVVKWARTGAAQAVAQGRSVCEQPSAVRQVAGRWAGIGRRWVLLNHEQIIDGLFEFSNEEEQRRLWLGEGQEKWKEISSLIEARCMLFVDSALDEKIYSQGTEFGTKVDSMLREIDELTCAIDTHRRQEKIITDPKMALVRRVASAAHGRIMSMGRKNVGRIFDRVLEWRDEDRQRTLWLPSAGKPPRSSPHCADWHLFHGKDYWGYLDLGANKRELSVRFWDLSLLVGDLRTFSRPPESVLADPLMEPIREMAARIASRLGIA